jgi:hypothetical protein
MRDVESSRFMFTLSASPSNVSPNPNNNNLVEIANQFPDKVYLPVDIQV